MEANCSILRQADTKLNEIFIDEEDEEWAPTCHRALNDHVAGSSGANFINISDEEDD